MHPKSSDYPTTRYTSRKKFERFQNYHRKKHQKNIDYMHKFYKVLRTTIHHLNLETRVWTGGSGKIAPYMCREENPLHLRKFPCIFQLVWQYVGLSKIFLDFYCLPPLKRQLTTDPCSFSFTFWWSFYSAEHFVAPQKQRKQKQINAS